MALPPSDHFGDFYGDQDLEIFAMPGWSVGWFSGEPEMAASLIPAASEYRVTADGYDSGWLRATDPGQFTFTVPAPARSFVLQTRPRRD